MIKTAIQRFVSGIVADVADIEYPEEILSHAGKPLPVSKGGIILINDPDDIVLLPQDGITMVELDRDLGDEFYRAAEEAGEDVVLQLSKLFRHIELSTRRQHFYDSDDAKEKYAKAIEEFRSSLNEQPHIVVQQAMDDIINHYDIAQKLKDSTDAAMGRQYTPLFRYGGRDAFEGIKSTGFYREMPIFHVEELNGEKSRGGTAYIGKSTLIVDDRLSTDHIRKVVPTMSDRNDPEIDTTIPEQYSLYSPKIGNPFYIKAYNGFHDEQRRGFDAVETIRNSSVHSKPETEAEEPRFSYFYNIS